MPPIDLYITAAIVNLALTMIVLVTNYDSKHHRAFAFFTVVQCLWCYSLYLGYHNYLIDDNLVKGEFFMRMAYGSGLLMPVSLSYFFYNFPTPKRSKSSLKTTIILALLVSLITLFTSWVHESGVVEQGRYMGDKFGPLYWLYAVTGSYFFVLGFYYSIQSYRQSFADTKIKTTVTAVSAWFFLTTVFIINVLLPAFNIYILPFKAILFSFLFSIPTIIVISKMQFFSLPIVGKQILHLSMLCSIFAIINFLTSGFLKENTATVIAAISTIVISQIASRPKSSKERQLTETITQLTADIRHYEDPENLQTLLTTQLDLLLKFDNPRLYLVHKEILPTAIETYISDKHTKALSQSRKALIKQNNTHPLHKKTNSTLIIPLIIDRKLVGMFTANKPYYYKEEINHLLKLKTPLQNYLLNHLVKENLCQDNNILSKAVQKRTSTLTDFIALTAHELRTPLSVALFQLEETIYNNQNNPQVTKDMLVIERSLNNLRNLTERLFQVQKFDLKKIRAEKTLTDLTHFITRVKNNFSNLLKKQNKSLSVDLPQSPVPAMVDPSLFYQVLTNLVNNAIKFGDKVSITLRKQSKSIKIIIADNGPGIPKKDKKRIFKKFQTKDSSMTLGIGLGLYICKKILDLHDANIYIKDVKPQGAAFVIDLPLKSASPKEKGEQ